MDIFWNCTLPEFNFKWCIHVYTIFQERLILLLSDRQRVTAINDLPTVLSCPLSVTIAWIIKSQLAFSLYRTRASVCGSCSNWFSSCRERYKGLPECLVSLPYCYCKLCREKVWNSCMVPNSWKLYSEQNQILYSALKPNTYFITFCLWVCFIYRYQYIFKMERDVFFPVWQFTFCIFIVQTSVLVN